MDTKRLERQLAFIVELDKVKQIFRNTILMDASRKENDAEHSWHMAVAALVLAEYADGPDLDMAKVLKMIVLHDIVEIDAGDTFVYGNVNWTEKALKELRAAERICSMLPEDQGPEFLALWTEFEDGVTVEARYAQALDSFMPLLHNYRTKGLQWQRLHVTRDQVLARNCRIERGSPALWEYAQNIINDAVARGYLRQEEL